MSASKRPSTSSLRRFITSRPFVTVAELRRRFALEDAEGMARLAHNGTVAWIGLPDREAAKLQDLWERGDVGIELSVEVRAPVVVGVYPMRIASYIVEGSANGANGHAPAPAHASYATSGANGTQPPHEHHQPPRPMNGAPGYGHPSRHA